MRVVILVPRRADHGRRDEVWSWVRARWETEHPDYEVVEGHHDRGHFNRSAALNQAARDAGDWDVAIAADADTFVGADQAKRAVTGAWVDGRMWLAYDRFCYLGRSMSDQIMAGYTGMWESGVEFTMWGTCSSAVVVRRDVFDEARGFDDGFEGWGFEDVAASHAFQTFGNGLARAPGPAWHLWHAPSPENNHTSPIWQANRDRMMRYADVSYNPAGMRALIDELRPA